MNMDWDKTLYYGKNIDSIDNCTRVNDYKLQCNENDINERKRLVGGHGNFNGEDYYKIMKLNGYIDIPFYENCFDFINLFKNGLVFSTNCHPTMIDCNIEKITLECLKDSCLSFGINFNCIYDKKIDENKYWKNSYLSEIENRKPKLKLERVLQWDLVNLDLFPKESLLSIDLEIGEINKLTIYIYNIKKITKNIDKIILNVYKNSFVLYNCSGVIEDTGLIYKIVYDVERVEIL
jgi:hypothetical protein